ncbi:MAG: ribonuclease HII [Oceanococcus sp.]
MLCGVDEAGRGPLAGPVVAAAVILKFSVVGLDDSKRLSEKRRIALVPQIKAAAHSWSIACASPSEIDELNIHHATLLAMRRAVLGLSCVPAECIVDGKFVPELPCSARAVVGADASVAEVSAASILAKQWRDDEMRRWDKVFPDFGFAAHKGYPTAVHIKALQRVGPSVIHRYSYAPVARHLLNL